MLPEHTRDQMGLRIDRPDGRAVFCGDAVHSPTASPPAWRLWTSSCLDTGLAATTRRALLKEAASSGRVIVPAHFRGARRRMCAQLAEAFARFF